MSWKGIQKSVVRAPQNFRQKMNIGEITKDAIFIDAERRFKELEAETKKLHDESGKYYSAINSMLSHQIEFSKAIEEIYKPISGRMSDPNSIIPEGNPEGIAACEQYREIVQELQATLQPELEMLETRIVKPADELLEIVKYIRKLVLKRSHKQLDLDRHNNTLKKLREKKEKTLKDEKALYTAESNTEIAEQEYNYYNDMLKEDLPKLFQLETDFIKPLFQSFYYMQLNIFYTLYEKMNANSIEYFNLGSEVDIETAFNTKRGDVQERAEAIDITRFKVVRAKKRVDPKFRRPGGPGGPGGPGAKPASPGGYSSEPGAPPPYGYQQPAEYSAQNAYAQPEYQQPAPTGYTQPAFGQQPAYSQPGVPSYAAPTSPAGPAAYDAKTAYAAPAVGAPSSYGAKPPLPAEHVVAQFDYAAQAEGDLSFHAGDRIEIVQRTADPNGWWTGKLNGAQGVFPGNYVAFES
ncbi:BAR domain-containing protein [Lipomyces japonicus]|uniref:BAR domain-containing protein n=1 Tax=Lipomyces japonicus TaxID=56871 RepID=UPI0034CE0D32